MAIDPDIQPLLDALEQRVVSRLDAMSNRVDQHANHLQVLGAADNALNSADKALEKQLAALTERVVALETTQAAPSFPPAYFTDGDVARIQANGVTPAVSALLASKPGRDVLAAAPAPVVEVRAPSSGTLSYVQAHPELGGAAGDQAIINDSHLAYVAAILWLATGDERYAEKAAELVEAWRVCERILFDQPRRDDNRSQVWANGKLVAAWSAPLFQRAADILTRTGRPCSFTSGPWIDVMTAPVYGWTGNQNWILSQAAALLELGHPDARDYLIAQVPACIALGNSATNLPPAQSKQFNDTTARVKAWGSPTAWPDGLCQESFSDMGHALMGISAAVNAAAFCRNIGDPLPDDIEARIVAAVELHAGWLLQTFPVLVNGNTPTGWTPTGWPFTTPFRMGGTAGFNGWAVGASTFGDRVPLATMLAIRVAPEGFAHHSSYGTATHT